jgi:hypothetical protein
MLVYVCICMYMYVYVCIYLYLVKLISSCQAGLFPYAVSEYNTFPLTCGKSLPPTERIESFHMAVGNLRCFNAALNDEEKKIRFDWFNRDNVYILGAKRVFPYTDLFWAMFFKVIARLGPLKAIVLYVRMYMYVYDCICTYMLVFDCI